MERGVMMVFFLLTRISWIARILFFLAGRIKILIHPANQFAQGGEGNDESASVEYFTFNLNAFAENDQKADFDTGRL